jgi:hypothetical protein
MINPSHTQSSRWKIRRLALRAFASERMPGARHGIRRMPPIALTDVQLTAVFEAARPLAVASRDAFLLDLATALQGIADPRGWGGLPPDSRGATSALRSAALD